MTSVNATHFSACLRYEQKSCVSVCMAVTSVKILPQESFISFKTKLSKETDFLVVELLSSVKHSNQIASDYFC